MALSHQQYRRWVVGFATLPIYLAGFFLLMSISQSGWFLFLTYIPLWFAADWLVFRLYKRQVLERGSSRHRFTVSLFTAGLLLDILIGGLFYALQQA